jgi:hypothetical protein
MTLRRSIGRVPWPVVAIVVVAIPFSLLVHDSTIGDEMLFYRGGELLLSRHALHAFADARLQVGPLQLLLFGAASRLGPALDVGRSTLLSVAIQASAAVLVVVTTLAVLRERPARNGLAFAAGLVVLLSGITLDAFDSGHPANVWIPLAWITAGLAARRDRPLLAGVLIGLSCGFEVWGLLGVPVLLLAPSLRRAALAVAAAGVTVVALFLPFVLAGDFHMLEYRWRVADGVPVALVLRSGSGFGWPLRLVQGALTIAAAVGVIRVARGSLNAVWLVPLGIVLVRLLLDPQLHLYYFLEVALPAIVGGALLASTLPGRQARPATPPPL